MRSISRFVRFPVDEVNIVVQDELVNGLYTGENSCLEVMNFTHRVFSAKTTPVRLASVVCFLMAGIVDAF